MVVLRSKELKAARGFRRILVSSSGTHSVRSDRVVPDSLRIFRGLYFTILRRA